MAQRWYSEQRRKAAAYDKNARQIAYEKRASKRRPSSKQIAYAKDIARVLCLTPPDYTNYSDVKLFISVNASRLKAHRRKQQTHPSHS